MFPQQISVMGMTQLPGQQHQQMQQGLPFAGYSMVTQMTQQQVQQMQSQQQQQLIQHHQQAQQHHQQAQQQRGIQVLPKQEQNATNLSVTVTTDQGNQPQQMLPPRVQLMQQQQQYTTMYQQPIYSDHQMQTIPVMQGNPQASNLPSFSATSDPNAFLHQMQAAQTLQYSIQPQVLAPASQHLPIPVPSHQAVLSSSANTTLAKRKASELAHTNVVSSSDTDGESRAPGLKLVEIVSKSKRLALQLPSEQLLSSCEDNLDFDIDTSNMTSSEKAKANRDRNREHARNTRLRKKAYLEKLKSTVDELCRERDTLISERAGAANLLVEMHNTRTEVLMSFFALRSTYEKQRELWSSILDESCFACVMPVTPYRSFPASEVQVSKCQRTIMGIDGVMADTASLHVLLNSLIDRSRFPMSGIQFRYTLVTEDAVVAGNQMMARWVMSTLNATNCGARMEVSKQGMLCAKFNSAHKIIGLELMFDVMAFMLQLKQASGSELFSVVPNTVQTCQRNFDLPMVLTMAERPYTIVQVNKQWEEMTGFSAEDVVGKASCIVLQGQDTNYQTIQSLMNEVRHKRPASAMVLNYTRQGKGFHNFLSLFPLSTDSKVTHYVALTSHVDNRDSIVIEAPQKQQQTQLTAHVLPTTSVVRHPTVLLSGIPVISGITPAVLSQVTSTRQGPTQPLMTFYQPQAIPSMPVMLPTSLQTTGPSLSACQHSETNKSGY